MIGAADVIEDAGDGKGRLFFSRQPGFLNQSELPFDVADCVPISAGNLNKFLLALKVEHCHNGYLRLDATTPLAANVVTVT